MNVLTGFWLIGFAASIACFIASISDYRKKRTTKKAIIISGIICFIFGIPVILAIILIMGLSTGLAGM